jgi:hypothetical protein
MSKAALKEVYRRIASGEDKHGDFLTAFAQAVGRADPDNFQFLFPAARLLAQKYKLSPDVQLNTPCSSALEQLAITLAVQTGSKGVVIALLHQGDRMEVVSGLLGDEPDLAGVLQKLADSVRDGDGMPLGRNGHTIIGP